MKYLLDTHVFLWLATDVSRLSPRVRMLCEAEENALFLSSISVWEIEQKVRADKLHLPVEPKTFVAEFYSTYDICGLAFDEESAFILHKLPLQHGDPFDRMLICQAIHHGMAIVSADRHIHQYPINAIW